MTRSERLVTLLVRPICPYPQMARLEGGDANDPANYACVVR